MIKFVSPIKLKMDKTLLKTNLPLFHYSIFIDKRLILKICPIFSSRCRIPKRKISAAAENPLSR